MMKQLEQSRSDEDKQAEIINDIRFVQTLERGIKRDGTKTPAVA